MYLIGFFARHFIVAFLFCFTLSSIYALDIPCIIQQGKICQVQGELHIKAEDDFNIMNAADVMQLKHFIIRSPSTVKTVPKQLFKALPNLEDVQFSGVQLNQLRSKEPFESASSLRSIEISRNKLKVIPRDAFLLAPKLMVLDLTMNHIESVEDGAFNGLPKLKNLYLDKNQITTLKRGIFAGAPHLNEIYLNDNEINAIENGVFDLPELRILSIKNNLLVTLPPNVFATVTKLESLDLSSNQLVNTGELDLPELKILSIKNNLLVNLPPNVFATVPKLENLDLSSNQLVNASEALSKATALTKINLDNNPDLEDVNLSKLILLPALLWLSLRNTSFIINRSAPIVTTSPLATLDLSSADLDHSDLLVHLQHLKGLEKLYLQDNLLKQLDKIEEIKTFFPKLTELNLSDNRLDCRWLDTLFEAVKSKNIELGDDIKCAP